MAHQRTFNLPVLESQPPCIYLRSKQIYVTGNPDPDDPLDIGTHRYNCWCNKTQHVRGPDDQLVRRADCVSGRQCYVSR